MTRSYPRPAYGWRLPPFVELWHPASPGERVIVRPSLWRRLGLVREPFATLGEVIESYRDRDLREFYAESADE